MLNKHNEIITLNQNFILLRNILIGEIQMH